jgi:hypothetical protein
MQIFQGFRRLKNFGGGPRLQGTESLPDATQYGHFNENLVPA